MSDWKDKVHWGDIITATFEGRGSEQDGSRPCVVVSNDKGNRFGPTLIVIPITAQDKKPLPTHVVIGDYGITSASRQTILCEQIRTIDKSRVNRFCGSLTTRDADLVEKAMNIALRRRK